MSENRPYQLGSIQANEKEHAALLYLRAHPVPFVLASEVRTLIVETAIKRGWKWDK